MGKNDPFFGFKDDQESNASEQASVQQPEQNKEEEDKQNGQLGEHKNINVKGGIPDDEENGIQANVQATNEVKLSTKKTLVTQAGSAFLAILLSLFFNITVLYPLLIFISIFLFIKAALTFFCTETKITEVFGPLIIFVFSCSIIMVCFETFKGIFYEKDIYSFWYIENFFLFLTHIMIFSIIQMTKQNSFELQFKNICTICTPNNFTALVINIGQGIADCDTIIDIPRETTEWETEYKRIVGDVFEVDIDSQRFNTFANKLKHPNVYQFIGYQFIRGQEQPLQPNMFQFIVLQIITALKIVCCVCYLLFHNKFGWYDFLTVVLITLFTVNEVYCLNIMLSSYDLRRKTLMCQKINKSIVISGKLIDYEKVIDVTNSESIETWDNSRRCVLEFFSEVQEKLERSYICLFLYYLFVTAIILAAYGEIYVLIGKESILLTPLIVISSTFTFIFLNAVIFFRLHFGSKFNETFEDVEDSVDSLIGIYQDLIQMYDYNFTQRGMTKNDYLKLLVDEEEEEEQEGEHEEVKSVTTKSRQQDEELCASQLEQEVKYYTCYDIMISKFMFLSEYYIQKGFEFQGKVYRKEEEKLLQQRMMQNCLKSFKRIKQQIVVDAKLKCYKAFNIVKLDFKDTLFTISLGLLTLLPQIITKFIELFQNIESKK